MRYRLGLEAAAPDLAYVSHAERYIAGFMVNSTDHALCHLEQQGGVGKSFLTFVFASEYASVNPDKVVYVIDMCPQANVSEICWAATAMTPLN